MKRNYKGKDRFNILAKKRGVPSRAFFKLSEILNKILKKRFNEVIDLGCAPGGWSAELVNHAKRVIGVDIVEPKFQHPRFIFVKGNITEEDTIRKLKEITTCVDAIFSDLAPALSGIPDVDQERAFQLVERAREVCELMLKKGGYAVVKTFQGSRWEDIHNRFKKMFSEVKVFKPEASRRSLREVYLIGKGFKGGEG